MIIEQELKELESHIPEFNKLRTNVSSRSVGWHVLHSLKVIHSILSALKKSKPERYAREFNFLRIIFFAFNRFPRGKAKAPKRVKPDPEQINPSVIEELLNEVRATMHQIETLHPNAYFRHPYFGKLNIEHTSRFLKMHSRHHLKIIEDIRGNKP